MEKIREKTKNYNILLVDDEEDVIDGMQPLLQKLFKSVDIAKDGKEAFAKYLKHNYDIIITDLTMPKMDGIELMERVKEINPFQKIIILTAHQDKDYILEALSYQADGYLIKPLDFDELMKVIVKVSHQIELEKVNEDYRNSLEELLIKKTEELKKSFFTDDVTKLYNCNKLKEDLQSLEDDVYFVWIDISNFRKINSIFGIEQGNLVLKNITLFFKTIFPNTTLYRLRDSSLAYIFPKKDNNIHDILETLKNKLSEFKMEINSIEMKFSFKVLAVSGKKDVLDKYSLVSSFVKDKGIKQIYQYFDDKIEKIKENQQNRLFWVNKTLEAVNNSNIEPFFQAIVDNQTQKIVKYEILARLKDGEKYVSPYFFIDPAKEAGILVLITRMIIEKSFKKIANTDLSISINITFYDLEEKYLAQFLEEKLKENNLKANQITIEILEGIESEANNKHLNQLLELKEKGFVIAIDDFGTGYSNFQRVYQIQPDFIKIDGLYIKDITTNENSLKITKAIISFAKNIGAKTIAEFVETKEIYEKVKELGVDYSQGYYFSIPLLEFKE